MAAPAMTWSSTFAIPGMDCRSEERLEPEAGIRALEFDLAGRRLRIVHEGKAGALVAWTEMVWPDLVIGLAVLNGARRILAVRA